MERFNLETAVGANLFVLRLTGILPPGDNSFYRRFSYPFSIISQFFDIIVLYIPFFVEVWMLDVDIRVAVYCGQLNFHYAVAMFKCHQIWKLRDVVKEMFQMSTEDILQGTCREEHQVLRDRFKYWTRMCWTYNTALFITLAWITLNPIIEGIISMPLPSWYPFDAFTSPAFQICYVLQAIAVWQIGMANCNADTFTAALLVYMSCQCKMLNMSLLSFESDDTGTPDERLARFVRAIQHHQKILEFLAKIEKVFGLSCLLQLLSNLCAMTSCMYTLYEVDVQNPEFTRAFVYIFAITCQLYMYCGLGELLISESMDTADSLMCMPWYNESVAFKKLFLIFLSQCQYPIALQAGGFVNVSHLTFATITQTSYSYLTMLIQISN